MSSIDTRETELIQKISEKIHESCPMEDTRSPYQQEEGRETYWETRQPSQKCMEIVPYGFQSPKELNGLLLQAFPEDFKKEFILPVTVAAFKRRGETAGKGEVSPYIYEF